MKKKRKKIPVCFTALSEASQRSWTIPEFYEDETYRCVDCGKESLFTAEMQREWYEVKKRYFFQRPIRCSEHHEEWRLKRKSKFKMDRALAALRKNPESENAMQTTAKAIIDFHKKTGNGNLQAALHLLRKLGNDDELLNYCKEKT